MSQYYYLTAPAADWVGAGSNQLYIGVEPTAAGDACGVYVRGQISRFDTIHITERLGRADVEATVDVGHLDLPAGTNVHTRQWATNGAGLSTVTESDKVFLLDDTPPSHAEAALCTAGGFAGADGICDPSDTLERWRRHLCCAPHATTRVPPP